MLIELGNHDPVYAGPDERPKVTTVSIPEFDAEHVAAYNHYGHAVGGISVADFKSHRADAADYNQGVTNLGQDAEALLAITAAWPTRGRGRPAWVKATPHELTDLRDPAQAADIERFLSEFYEVPTLTDYFRTTDVDEAHVHKELNYWTNRGAPGELGSDVLNPPDIQALYTVDGRIMNNNNDGGDTLLVAANSQGVGSASTATVLTTTSTLVGTTALPGHRIVVYTLSGNVFVWGNIISNTSGVNGTITVDQWYVPATPGGTAGATPGTPWAWMVLDGGFTSTWFAAWGYGGTPTLLNTDHTLATGGQTEYVQAGGTAIRKICPTATDVSASARTVTLVPVFTANATDVGTGAIGTHPMDIVGFFASMVTSFGGAGGPMKFEDAVSPTATMAAVGDNVTITEVISGS